MFWIYDLTQWLLCILMMMPLAITTGLMVFLTVAMDQPFCGRYSVGTEPYELVRSQLMSP